MNVFIVDIESIPSRYTSEWKTTVPTGFEKYINDNKIDASIQVIEGKQISSLNLNGAFLDFAATNVYKSHQIEKVSELISKGEIKSGDYVLFTDFWHPGAINLRYMIDLLKLNIKMGGLVHAGSHDPNDFLGRLKDKSWIYPFEKSLYAAFDHLFFATDSHIKQYLAYFEIANTNKIVRTGWPLEYVKKLDVPTKKENIILFPHRIAPEKQLDIFKDLAYELPEYGFVVCQGLNLSKPEYHEYLRKSKIVFSASLQETLGISQIEAIYANSFSMVPDRLSYTEMYDSFFKYKSEWTQDFDSYKHNKYHIIQNIKTIMRIMDNPEGSKPYFDIQKEKLKDFIEPINMYKAIFNV